MNDLERTYFDAAFASQYPEFAEAEREEQKKEAPKPKQPAMTASDAGAVTLDTLAALLKGSVAGSLGWPGDIEGVVRLLTGGEQKYAPTTEDIAGAMPPVIPEGAQADPRRRSGVPGAQAVGELMSVGGPVVGLTKGLVKAIRKGVTK